MERNTSSCTGKDLNLSKRISQGIPAYNADNILRGVLRSIDTRCALRLHYQPCGRIRRHSPYPRHGYGAHPLGNSVLADLKLQAGRRIADNLCGHNCNKTDRRA